MIVDFLLQFFLSLIFIIGLVGVGLLILKVLGISQNNKSLTVALAFFVSLCAYTTGGVFLLFIFPNPLQVLAVYSIIYFLVSVIILCKYVYSKREVFLNKEYFLRCCNTYWPVAIMILFVVAVFFLGIYKTALLDEWLHRPIVKFFIENNQFPLKNPYDFLTNFTATYHYGMHIAVASVENIFHIGVSQSMDVVKIGIVIATLLLIYGVIRVWGVNKKMAIWGAILILFAGGSFFLFDGFSANHLGLWNSLYHHGVPTLNYSLLYTLNGITWVNVPLAFASLLIVYDLFYSHKNFRIVVIILLSFIFAGLFLISELFGVALLLLVVILIIKSFFQRHNNKINIITAVIIFILLTVGGIYFGGGLLTKTFTNNPSLSQFLTLRSPTHWGYPTINEILTPVHNFGAYIRNFLLEFLALIIFIIAIFRKKVSFTKTPFILWVCIAMFIIPFIFSTSFGNTNLYKLTHFGIFIAHIILFAYIMNQQRIWLRNIVIGLFIFSALPIVLVNGMIQWGNSPQAQSLRCAQNDLCYPNNVMEVLSELQKYDSNIKYVFTGSENDTEEVVSMSNSYSIPYNPNFIIENVGRRYIFVSPQSFGNLGQQQLDYLLSLKKISEHGGYVVYSIDE